MAQHLACRGEGDCLNREESNTNLEIKNQLEKMTTELNEKDTHISKLDEQLKIVRNELSTCGKDCNALSKQNKDRSRKY